MPKSRRGFTLVELLIVVAIVSVLATIGVPTYKRMIMKSKQAEAKVLLGGLRTAESVFYAEWNLYTNNLTHIGFEAEANYYSVGFAGASGCENATELVPSATHAAIPDAAKFLANSPSYLAPGFQSRILAADTQPVDYCSLGNVSPPGAGPGVIQLQCTNGLPVLVCNSPCYLALASGLPQNGIPRSSATQETLDIWGVNPTSHLVNICSYTGVQTQQGGQQQGNQ